MELQRVSHFGFPCTFRGYSCISLEPSWFSNESYIPDLFVALSDFSISFSHVTVPVTLDFHRGNSYCFYQSSCIYLEYVSSVNLSLHISLYLPRSPRSSMDPSWISLWICLRYSCICDGRPSISHTRSICTARKSPYVSLRSPSTPLGCSIPDLSVPVPDLTLSRSDLLVSFMDLLVSPRISHPWERKFLPWPPLGRILDILNTDASISPTDLLVYPLDLPFRISLYLPRTLPPFYLSWISLYLLGIPIREKENVSHDQPLEEFLIFQARRLEEISWCFRGILVIFFAHLIDKPFTVNHCRFAFSHI